VGMVDDTTRRSARYRALMQQDAEQSVPVQRLKIQ